MNIVLLGAPGSGKGTLGAQLSKEYGIPHISSGDIVREQIARKTPLGLKVAALTSEGKLLTDTSDQMGELFDLIRNRLMQRDCRNGFILDGVPRTLWQAEQVTRLFDSLENKMRHVTILLATSDEVVVERLSSRVSCSACKRVYSIKDKKCRDCGSIYSEQRADDAPDVVQARLQIYHTSTEPVIALYKAQHNGKDKVFIQLDGDDDWEEVLAKAKDKLFPRDYLAQRIPSYPPSSTSSKKVPFYNLVELYKDAMLVQHIVNSFSKKLGRLQPDYIAAPEARALPVFGALAYKNNIPGIFIRKAGKLPEGARKLSTNYQTAYSSDVLEMNYDDLRGKTVVLVDDGISSGGTTLAMVHLLQSAGARVVGIFAVVRYYYRSVEPEFAAWERMTHTLFELGL